MQRLGVPRVPAGAVASLVTPVIACEGLLLLAACRVAWSVAGVALSLSVNAAFGTPVVGVVVLKAAFATVVGRPARRRHIYSGLAKEKVGAEEVAWAE